MICKICNFRVSVACLFMTFYARACHLSTRKSHMTARHGPFSSILPFSPGGASKPYPCPRPLRLALTGASRAYAVMIHTPSVNSPPSDHDQIKPRSFTTVMIHTRAFITRRAITIRVNYAHSQRSCSTRWRSLSAERSLSCPKFASMRHGHDPRAGGYFPPSRSSVSLRYVVVGNMRFAK